MTEMALPVRAVGDGVDAVSAGPRLNLVSAPQFTAAVADLIGRGHRRLVVDLTDTVFMDSSGLGALVACLKKARQAGGDLRLANAREQVSTVLELTNLTRVLRPADSVEQAAAAFGAP